MSQVKDHPIPQHKPRSNVGKGLRKGWNVWKESDGYNKAPCPTKEQCEQARWLLLVEKTIRAIEMSPNFAFMENVMFCCGCVDVAHWLSAAGVMCRCVGDRGCDTSFRPPTSIGLAYPIIITIMITMAINDYHHHQNHHHYDSGCDIFFWPLTSIV